MDKVDVPKVIIIGSVLLIAFFVIGIIIFTVSNIIAARKNSGVNFIEDFELLQPLVQPDLPEFPDDYYLLRTRDYEWTQSDIDKWFTMPDGILLDELHDANDAMITEILEAAP